MILCLLLFTSFFVKAQTADETLDWLRTKQSAISRSVGDLKIDETSIKVSNEDKITTIQWGKIKDVRLKFRDITIVSDDLIDGKNTFNREKFEGVNPSVTQENDAITSNGRLTAAMWNGAATIAVFPAEKF